MKQIVDKATESVKAKMSKVIGWTETELDARSGTVRARESSLGNLTADLMLHAYPNLHVDVALLCGGTIRADKYIFRYFTFFRCLCPLFHVSSLSSFSLNGEQPILTRQDYIG